MEEKNNNLKIHDEDAEVEIEETENEFNNARIQMLGGYTAVYDIEQVTGCEDLFRARPLNPKNMLAPKGMNMTGEEDFNLEIFFTRSSNPDKVDLDYVYREVHVVDTTILGRDFWLIPKHKCVFCYEEKTGFGIIKPLATQPIHRQ